MRGGRRRLPNPVADSVPSTSHRYVPYAGRLGLAGAYARVAAWGVGDAGAGNDAEAGPPFAAGAAPPGDDAGASTLAPAGAGAGDRAVSLRPLNAPPRRN